MTTTEVEVIQKKGFYQITTPAGGKAKLTRVTTVLDWVLKDGTGAMSYYGGKLFAKFLAENDEEVEEFYTAWKASEFDPNRTLRSAADRGTGAHSLFEKLLKGEATYTGPDHDGDYFVEFTDDIPFLATSFDRGVVELYRDQFEHLPSDRYPLSEVRLYWTEHPIDDCPEPDAKGFCTHGFSGTCDVYFPHYGIEDLKTHKPGYRWSEWGQMALYSLAAQQLYGADIRTQRILLAHDFPNEETGKYYEVQDDRFLSSRAGELLWELFTLRKGWGPRD